MKTTRPLYFIGTVLTVLAIQCTLLADCPNQDVICCLEHNYPLGGPIAYNQGTCWTWPPSCAGILPTCCICNHEQAGLDATCQNAHTNYPPELVTAELSQNCILPTTNDKEDHREASKP